MRHRTMPRVTSTILALALLLLFSPAVARAQVAPSYPQDDKLANEPAPWTVPGKWARAATGAGGASRTNGGCSTTSPPT